MASNAPLDHELIIPGFLWKELASHLFRGDADEHGAVIAAGVAADSRRVRLLARHLFIAQDGVSYVAGQRGYRMLTGEFVRDQAMFCRDEKLAYLAIHNHFGRDSVAFSADDIRSHERGYPALRDITRGQIVGAAVFAENAAAGDIWLAHERVPLKVTRVLGSNIVEMYPSPLPRPEEVDAQYDRQARLFGDRGQALLGRQRVGIIGLGGIGSLVAEYLSRLGVGCLVLVDPDRLEPTNLSRVVGSTHADATPRSSKVGAKHHRETAPRFKVDVAAREARRASAQIEIVKHARSVVDDPVARDLAGCDYLFLAADSMQARLVFNALVHQFLIPGVQLGAKVPVDAKSGLVQRVFSVVRPVTPGRNCLWCNGLIPPNKLQEEALSPEERRAQRYVEEAEIPAPSVITLNALAASHAVNDYLFRITGLREETARDDYLYLEPRSGLSRFDEPRSDPDCIECSNVSASRFARGHARSLPTRPGRPVGRRRR